MGQSIRVGEIEGVLGYCTKLERDESQEVCVDSRVCMFICEYSR